MSKFAGLFEQVESDSKAADKAQGRTARRKTTATVGKAVAARPAMAVTDAPRRGRPPGKHSDPDFVQTTAYIRKTTRRDVKKALLDHEREYSELVEELLTGWLKTQGKSKTAE